MKGGLEMAGGMDLWQLIGNVSSIIGILGAFFAFRAWVNLRLQNKRLLETAKCAPPVEGFSGQRDFASNIYTMNPYAFALSLTPQGGPIRKDVQRFLDSMGGKYKDMPIVELNYDGLGPHNLEQFINDLRVKRREFEAHGATEIHLFLAGPVQAGTLIGAMFDNWRPVKLYHNNRTTGTYEFWCPLLK
jgi:SMODS-associated and fused to various effectors sensor domain